MYIYTKFEDRPERFTTDPAARRELMVQIGYPAKQGASSAPAPYLQDADVVITALARLHNLPDFTRHLKGRPAALLDGPGRTRC